MEYERHRVSHLTNPMLAQAAIMHLKCIIASRMSRGHGGRRLMNNERLVTLNLIQGLFLCSGNGLYKPGLPDYT